MSQFFKKSSLSEFVFLRPQNPDDEWYIYWPPTRLYRRKIARLQESCCTTTRVAELGNASDVIAVRVGGATAPIWGALEYTAVVTCAEFVATEGNRPEGEWTDFLPTAFSHICRMKLVGSTRCRLSHEFCSFIRVEIFYFHLLLAVQKGKNNRYTSTAKKSDRPTF
jgi:hypothetical protein